MSNDLYTHVCIHTRLHAAYICTQCNKHRHVYTNRAFQTSVFELYTVFLTQSAVTVQVNRDAIVFYQLPDHTAYTIYGQTISSQGYTCTLSEIKYKLNDLYRLNMFERFVKASSDITSYGKAIVSESFEEIIEVN